MASTVAATILGVQANRVQTKTYVAVNKEAKADEENAAASGGDVLENTAAGHMIFDYDPRGGPDSKRRAPQAAWRIPWQKELIDADAWTRL